MPSWIKLKAIPSEDLVARPMAIQINCVSLIRAQREHSRVETNEFMKWALFMQAVKFSLVQLQRQETFLM